MRATTMFLLTAAAWPLPMTATPGGLNAEGCHNDRKGGTGYHCHGGSAPKPTRAPVALKSSGAASYRSCAAARAAGVTPLRTGDAGYGRHLDRDGDGIACE